MRRALHAMLPAVAVAPLLGGCPPSQWAPMVELAVGEKQAASDAEAALMVRAPCLMTVGALFRLPAQSDREAVALLCGGARAPAP